MVFFGNSRLFAFRRIQSIEFPPMDGYGVKMIETTKTTVTMTTTTTTSNEMTTTTTTATNTTPTNKMKLKEFSVNHGKKTNSTNEENDKKPNSVSIVYILQGS